MGLERASTIGGDGIGVAGMANLEQQVTSTNQVQTFSTGLLVKNMPHLAFLFSPVANPAGITAVIQIAQRGANAPGSQAWVTLQTVVIGALAPTVVNIDFPTDFVRVGITGGNNAAHTVLAVIGCNG